MTPFIPANQLYDVDSRTLIAHPSIQATDDDVRRALEALDDRDVRTDGGCSSREADLADELLRAAATGAARCLAHGHRFDGSGSEPVVVQRPGGNLEVFCRMCAEHYGETIIREMGAETDSKAGDSR